MQRSKTSSARTLIAIDGLDGSGKETQTKLLEQALKEKGIPCRTVSFPTYDSEMSAAVNLYLQGRFGEDPNAVNGYAASTFYAVDRFCSYHLDWRKDYEAGTVILANRYTTANAVHQLSKLPPEEYDVFLGWLFDFEYGKLGLPAPDLVLYLCVPPAVSTSLIRTRAAETGRKTDIHEKSPSHLQDSYRAALYASEKLGWKTVHCAGDAGEALRAREDIHSEVLGYAEQLLRNQRKVW